MKYLIDPTPNRGYFRCLAEVVKHQLGDSAEVSQDYTREDGTWILNFRSFRNKVQVPGPYIVLQTEQMDEQGTRKYREFLKQAVKVWDWTSDYFFGYSPVYRLWMEQAKTIPVLFYGEMNETRRKVCTKAGAMVVTDAYGAQIMDYVMKSKIVLSTHYYRKPCNDMPRIAPLLSVNAFVICEKTIDPKFNALSDHLVIVEKEAIPETVAYYLDRPLERIAWADKGTAWIKQHPHGLKS